MASSSQPKKRGLAMADPETRKRVASMGGQARQRKNQTNLSQEKPANATN